MSKKPERRKLQPAPPRRAPLYPIVFVALILCGVGAALLLSKRKKPAPESLEPLSLNPSLPELQHPLHGPAATSTVQQPAPAAETWRTQIASLPKEEQAEAYAARGDDSLEAKRFEEAAEAYRLALERDPSSESVHYNLGIALARAGKTDEAIAAYEQALKIAPDYAEAHNNLGNLLMQKQQFVEAIQHFTEATRINPDVANSHNNLGIALARLGRNTEAAAEFAKAVSLDTDYVEARFNLAQSHLARGDSNAATTELKELLRQHPNFTPAQQVLSRMGATEKAGN